MTIAAGESMVGDAWVKAGNMSSFKGAVAFVGNTHSGINVANRRSAMTRGFFNSLFVDSSPNLGTSVLAGKHQIFTECSDQAEYEGFNLLGDPELSPWTTIPKPVEVSYLTTIPMGAQDFNIAVTKQGIPLSNALVCVMKGDEVYSYDYTNALGQVTFAINPTSLGTMSVTMTARNCLPYEGSTQVVPSSGPYPIYFANIINDPMPGGNNDGNLNPGEAINLSVGIKNVGSQVSNNVRATLRTTESQVQITDSIQNYGNILPDSILYCTPGFALQVAPACTNQQYLNFTLFIQDSVSNYTQNLSLVVKAGKLSYQSNTVSDPIPGGNNNGQLDPGESGKLSITILNSGTSGFNEVEVKVRSTDQYVTITDSTGHFGRISPGENKNNSNDPFALSISPQVPSGYRAKVQIVALGLGGIYEVIDSFNLILTIGEGNQSAPTGPDGYGYYCYDNTDVNSGQAPTYNWVEIYNIGQIITQITNANDTISNLTLPFTFRFYGQDYTAITVSSNGYLIIGTGTFNSGQNTPILNGCPNLIAPFWDDLDMRQQQGYGDAYRYSDATNHRYIIEYRQAAHYSEMWFWETFEVILLDPAYYPTPTGDGEIIFQYQTVSDGGSNTIGICDQTQTYVIQLVYNSEYEPNAASLIAGRAYRLTTVAPQTTPAPWLGLYAMNFSDSLGNNNGLAEPGENILINLTVKNLGEATAANVNSVLHPQDADAVVLDSMSNFGNIEPGNIVSNGTPYQIQISANPQDSIVNFVLNLTADSGYYTVLYFSLNLSGVIQALQGADSRQLVVTSPNLVCLPNPFNSQTAIRFSLPAKGKATLKIYDVSGKCLRRFLVLPHATSNRLVWDGADQDGKSVSEGIYFVTLTDIKNRVIINRKVVKAN
jgi:FlgD Ig-like domain